MFDQTGHLTDRAFAALMSNEDLPELTRLELAEHLAYCDRCLQRYTEALTSEPPLAPPVSCRETLLRRIRTRTLTALTSRYATAAAAVALALTLLWSDLPFPADTTRPANAVSAVSAALDDWGERCSDALETLLPTIQSIFPEAAMPGNGGNDS